MSLISIANPAIRETVSKAIETHKLSPREAQQLDQLRQAIRSSSRTFEVPIEDAGENGSTGFYA